MANGSDIIDYRLVGDDMQAVIVTLDPGEQVLAEAGTMLYMHDGVEMQTTTAAAGGEHRGLFGRMLGAAGRALAGESFFITTFSNTGSARADVAFSAPYPGKIVPMPLAEMGGTMLCQKDAFLAAARGTEISVAFQKKIGAGLFGGEGFILQKLQGDGLAFVHAGGSVFPLQLGPGQSLRVDTGCIVALQPSVSYDIQMVGGFKNALFGGEGLFFAHLCGPGVVYLQTLPFARLADRIGAATRGRGTGEG
ncbi:MAG: TIGR00266 family protein [Deltaproteobacteria bacterium]|nr:TIGR00266 family protein [Deltaproteobacteria bacterium]